MEKKDKLCKCQNVVTQKIFVVPQRTLDLINKNEKLAKKVQFICFTENPKDNEKPAGQKEQQREKPKPKEKGKVTIIEPETIETTDDDGAEPNTIESGDNTRTDIIEPGIIEQIEPEQQPEPEPKKPGKPGRGKGGKGGRGKAGKGKSGKF